MKHLKLLLALFLLTSAVQAQQLKTRTDGTFTQADTYLVGLKTLGVPFGAVNTLNSGLERNGQLFYNTTEKQLYVYDVPTISWKPVGAATDLTNYYTKPQADALMAAKANTDGSNATGTWPIGITGNAASATNWGGNFFNENPNFSPGEYSTYFMVKTSSYPEGAWRKRSRADIFNDLGINNAATINGSNATGTWPIGITGNAAGATKLATARTIAGVAFDGTANIALNNNAITNGAGYITASDIPAPVDVSGKANSGGDNATGTWPIGITGNSANTGAWNTLPRTAGGIADPGYIVSMNAEGSNAGYTTKGNLQNWLGIPSGGETLQSVTDRGNTTTSDLIAPRLLSSVFGGVGGETVITTNTGGDVALSLMTSLQKRLTILGNGNVGIGTTSPTEKLEVNGGIKGTKINITGSNTSEQFLISRSETPSQGFSIKAGGGETIFSSIEGTGAVHGSYIFNSTKGADAVERLRIDNTGNVGIGTTSPTEKLEVNGNVKINGNIMATNFSSGTYTPVITDLYNIDNAAPFKCQYTRVGSIVTVYGSMLVDTDNINTLASLFISLPIASDLALTNDLNGHGNTDSEDLIMRNIDAREAEDKARFVFATNANTDGNYKVLFSFMYELK